jgi:ketosteroid isomerase-like protein
MNPWVIRDPRQNWLTLEPVPSENIEIASRLIDAWNKRDLQAALDLMHPQCEVRPVEATETLRGHAGVAAAYRDWFEAFEEFVMEPEDFVARGDRVLVPMRQRARGKGSGLKIDERFYQLFTLRDGKVFRFVEYSEEADAQEALGNEAQ